MYLLDTNVISELRKLEKADAHVAAWSESHSGEVFFLSAMSILEVQRGMLLIKRRDPDQGVRLETWIHDFLLPRFAGRIFPVDALVALRCAALHVPDPRPERDALIAATALVHDLTLVTRNVVDFRNTGVRILNPWTAASP